MNRQLKDSSESDDISRRWYQLRSHHANVSFNLAIGLTTATAIFSIVTAVSVCMGNIPAVVATTAVGLTTGVATTRLFKLSDDANKRLDATAKELLDNE
jgi:hypothetical protein